MLEPDITVVSDCRGFPSLSVQEAATTTLSLKPPTTVLVHVTVKFSPASELPSLTIDIVGSGNADGEADMQPNSLQFIIIPTFNHYCNLMSGTSKLHKLTRHDH